MDAFHCQITNASVHRPSSVANASILNETNDVPCEINIKAGGFDDGFVVKMQAPPLLQSNFSLAVAYVTIMVVALVIGTLGNTMILLVSACFRSIRRTGYQFVVNLAAADLCVAAIADPLCVLGVVKGEAWFNDKPWLCKTVSSMCITACFCAFFNLLLASLNRYICLCHNGLYHRIFTPKACAAMCIGSWVVAFLAQFPTLVGWGDHNYDKKSHQCIWDRTAYFSYTLLVSVGMIGMPLCTMGVLYFLTFRKIYSTKVNLYKMDKEDPLRVKKVWMETVKSSKMLFVIFIFFVILWTPYAVVISVDVQDTLPVAMHLLVTMFAHMHSSVNCIVYVIGNRKFRLACLRILKCDACLETNLTLSESRTSGNIGAKTISVKVSSE